MVDWPLFQSLIASALLQKGRMGFHLDRMSAAQGLGIRCNEQMRMFGL